MLLVRDYVGHMASEVVKRLIEGNLIESKTPEAVTQRVRQRMMEELTVEDRDPIRQQVVQILTATLKDEEKADAEVRKRITSQKKEILEGSEEWDVLYRKYYGDELRRMGIAAAPDDRRERRT